MHADPGIPRRAQRQRGATRTRAHYNLTHPSSNRSIQHNRRGHNTRDYNVRDHTVRNHRRNA